MTTDYEPLPKTTEATARSILDAALAVHRHLGPGLLESVYEICLAHELSQRNHMVRTQVALPVVYDTIKLEAGYRVDLVVDECVVIEVKSVDALAPIHEAQLLTYLRFSERRLGFLINFNVPLLKQGVKRMIR